LFHFHAGVLRLAWALNPGARMPRVPSIECFRQQGGKL
jgi:hypothetical protein